MDVLLDTYRKLFKKGTHLYDGTIQWNNVRILIQSLSVHEQTRFQENDKIRKKPGTDIQDIPRRRREVEIYINPYEAYWEDRYYHRLFYSEPTPEFKKKVVHQYLEMMAWNMDYYTLGCKHWDMYYSYNYAPLLKDISTYFVDIKMVYSLSSPLTPSQLLAYVMPRAYLGYLPKEVQKKIKDKWYSNDFSLEWSYCTYLWESHVHFPCISLKEIKQL
jgi:5'-3' exonuclease